MSTRTPTTRPDGQAPLDAYRAIYAVVREIPRGRVTTYGRVAALSGLPGRARLVGYALNAVNDPSIPWHRVVNARGEISHRSDGGPGETIQRLRLEEEGVQFDDQGRIPLDRYLWRP